MADSARRGRLPRHLKWRNRWLTILRFIAPLFWLTALPPCARRRRPTSQVSCRRRSPHPPCDSQSSAVGIPIRVGMRRSAQRRTKMVGRTPPGSAPPDFRGSLEGNDAVDSAASFGGYTIWGVDPLRQYQKTHNCRSKSWFPPIRCCNASWLPPWSRPRLRKYSGRYGAARLPGIARCAHPRLPLSPVQPTAMVAHRTE